jgi:hypothetical protein
MGRWVQLKLQLQATGGYWISNELKTNAVLLFSLISFALSSYMFFTLSLLIYLRKNTWFLGGKVSSLLKSKTKLLTGLCCKKELPNFSDTTITAHKVTQQH